ncbi:hypothetical protein [Burkholderia sp. MSMB1078WGS]|uniref:hypothetical protein n=1 Tax=Burkholderia sp. MSMB1078WGS TaxID=1637900 RepID=UPI0012E360BF|nr:hypothetical protein [Burkholderia sp. MSMB1078WGS]
MNSSPLRWFSGILSLAPPPIDDDAECDSEGAAMDAARARVASIALGPVHANNGLANVPFRPQGKEKGGAIAVAIATTNDAAMRAERHVPLFGKNSFAGLAPRRAERRVTLLANTSSIRFVAILALGPSGSQRKPVISVNRP